MCQAKSPQSGCIALEIERLISLGFGVNDWNSYPNMNEKLYQLFYPVINGKQPTLEEISTIILGKEEFPYIGR